MQELTRHAIPSDNNNTENGKQSEKIVTPSTTYLIGAPQIIVDLGTSAPPAAAVAPHPIAPRPIQPKPLQQQPQPVDASKPFVQKLYFAVVFTYLFIEP